MSRSVNSLDERTAERFARMVLDNVVREYPNHLMLMLNGDADVLSPHELHPVFYGSYDWHSSVHSHWLLVRLLRLFPQAVFEQGIRELLDNHLTQEKIAVEQAYCEQPNRAGFERPYGLAWLLQLVAELYEWHTPDGMRWYRLLVPLAELVKSRFFTWLPNLTHPVRGGEHSQTAFALGLVFDSALILNDRRLADLVANRSRDFYLLDTNAPLAYEPSGHDFLSPALAEADLMRRILPRDEFTAWLVRFMPQIPLTDGVEWLQPVTSRDQADGKLAHLDGLNLSRAWMCEAIAAVLPEKDARRSPLLTVAASHARAGIAAIRAEHYAGSHWLPSFAVYLLTRRGMT